MKTASSVNALRTALGHDLGLGVREALEAKGDSLTAAEKAKKAKATVNDVIKRGAEQKIEWGKGNTRTNHMSKAFLDAIGTVAKVSDKTISNYLSTAKWCFENKVKLQTWDLNAQKAKEQIDILTNKPIELEGTGMGNDKHCVFGFANMQEKQEGFDEWVNVLSAKVMVTPEWLTFYMWEAMSDLGHAVLDGETAEWKAK